MKNREEKKKGTAIIHFVFGKLSTFFTNKKLYIDYFLLMTTNLFTEYCNKRFVLYMSSPPPPHIFPSK